MMGLFIHPGALEKPNFNHLCYYRFGEQPVLEITMENMLRVAQFHRVFVLLPREQQRNITGVKYGNPPVINAYRKGLGRLAIFEYYDGSVLDAMHKISLENGLTDIAQMSALDLFFPTWLANELVFEYFTVGARQAHTTNNPIGFRMDAFPFWYLAHCFLYSEDRDMVGRPERIFDTTIINTESSFEFANIEQAGKFEERLLMLSQGQDILDIIEDENGSQQKEND